MCVWGGDGDAMCIGSKTRYRLSVLALAAVALIVAGASAYAVRSAQITNDLRQSREVGVAALAEGEYSTATQEIGRYVQSYPDDIEALYAYARAMRHVPGQGRAGLLEAVRLCRRALELQPQHVGVGHELISVYSELGFATETIALAGQLLQYDHSDAVALQAKALALARVGQYPQALAVAAQHNELVPFDLDFQFATLQMMRMAGKGNEELMGYARSLGAAFPDNPQSDLVQAFASSIAGDRQAALEWTAKVASRRALDPDTLLRTTGMFDALGQFGEATHAVERAAASNPDTRISVLLLERRWRLCQWQQVIDYVRLIGGTDSLGSRTAALYATALIESGRPGQADAVLATLAHRNADAEAKAWLAVIPVAFGPEPAEAVPYLNVCKDAVARVPDNPYFCLLLARAYQRVGEPELANEYCRRAAEIAPDWSAPFVEQSRILLRLGLAADALAAAKEALSRSPEDPQVLIALASAATRASTANDTQQVAMALRLLDQIGPSWDEQVLPIRIALLARLGNNDDAAKALAQALATEPPLRRETLLSLAAISEEFGLDREDACYSRIRTKYGRTWDVAYAEACTQQRRGRPQEGACLFVTARSDAIVASPLEWKLAEARYLDGIGDPDAKALWLELMDANPENTAIQWGAVAAHSLASDRAARDRALCRLKDQIGPEGVAWRMARAKWLLEGTPAEAHVVEAAILASEATRIVPDQLPHLLFARCLERLGNPGLAVEQLAIAAKMDRPISETGQILVIEPRPDDRGYRITQQRHR